MDEVQNQYQARRDRRTAELMKRNPDHQLAISKAIARREDGLGSDAPDLRTTTQTFPPRVSLSQSAPSSSKRVDLSFSVNPTGRYPSLSDLRLALSRISKNGKNTDVVFSFAAESLRWTVQLKRQSPSGDTKASLKSVINMRNLVKPYNMLSCDTSSNTASQPITQPSVGSLTITIGELVGRENHWLKPHRKCYEEDDVPEEMCRCGEKRYIAPELTVQAAEGNDFLTVEDYVTSVTKWIEGDDIAEGLAEEWFPEGSGGCKRARVELLDPASLFLGLYEEKGCDLTEDEDRPRWMDVFCNHMVTAHDPWAEKRAQISERLRG